MQAKEQELREESPGILARMIELRTTQYPLGSKSLADAQAEYNGLDSQYSKLANEQTALSEQARKLYDQI